MINDKTEILSLLRFLDDSGGFAHHDEIVAKFGEEKAVKLLAKLETMQCIEASEQFQVQ